MVSYNRQRQVVEKNEITENLKVTISVAIDESEVFLDIDYMDGKYTIQKSFTNNYIGLEDLERVREEFDSEEKLKTYFNL